MGSDYANRHGVIHLGRLIFHIETDSNCCVVPIFDLSDAPYSILGNNPQSSYQAFQSASGTCTECNDCTSATERTTWGTIKGIYR